MIGGMAEENLSVVPDEVIYRLRDEASDGGTVTVDADILFQLCVEIEIRRHDAGQLPVEERHPGKCGMMVRFKGVHHQNGRWRARIGSRPTINLGRFDTPREAALAYDAAARALWGDFARPNFPDAEST